MFLVVRMILGNAGSWSAVKKNAVGRGAWGVAPPTSPPFFLPKERCLASWRATKEVSKGTGLGLATCFGIVKQNKGHIWVYSEVRHGTSFKIYLPRVTETGRKLTLSAPAGDLPRGTELILLVEDDDSVRNFARIVLHEKGYRLFEAENGKKALSLIENNGTEIDLLITDMIMPEMNGMDLADQLKKLKPDIKVLFISGYTENQLD